MKKLELVIGGGGALYPYFLGWTQGLVNNLSREEIDNIIFSTHSCSSLIPTLIGIWIQTGISPKKFFDGFIRDFKENIKLTCTGALFNYLNTWYNTSIEYCKNDNIKIDWYNSHVIMNSYSVLKRKRIIYNKWDNFSDFMKCSVSTCHIPGLSWSPIGFYRKDLVLDGCVLSKFHSQYENNIELHIKNYRIFPFRRIINLSKFDDYHELYNMGLEDMNKIIPEIKKKLI